VVHALFRTLAGRVLVASAILKALLVWLQTAGPLPAVLRAVNGAASVGLLVAVVYFVSRLVIRLKRRLLWRVRRKLIISYVFIGFIPTLLILAFFLFGGSLMFMNVSAYLFKDGYDDLVAQMQSSARETQVELESPGANPAAVLARRVAAARARYADLSMALVPVKDGAPIHAGPWWHLPPPTSLPAWLPADGFAGTLAVAPADDPSDIELVVRAVVPPPKGGAYAVVVDLPMSGQVVEHLYDSTSVRAGDVTVSTTTTGAQPLAGLARANPPAAGPATNPQAVPLLSFERSVAFLDYVDWRTGYTGLAYVSLGVRLGSLYDRISSVQGMVNSNITLGRAFLLVLVVVAVLFLIIEFVALVMGLTLARSITSSVHQLFMGTERVRQGDFTHRIHVKSQDQLGELAGSFNQMTSSIEDLLQEAAEKKRLEEELRIAREIQMSLLPPGPLRMTGLSMTALCVPAREVGGDYYDFFPLGDRRVGVLIADVAGKGTSAALYMAELKGLVLSLSQIWSSPRQLLIEANRILRDNLDSRAFITATYAVVDLAAGAMVWARAGHTPMIYMPAAGAGARVLTPNGMVVGLRIPGADEKFAELLDEQTIAFAPGDVFVLYTDGISEAMNVESDLFGEARLSRLVEEHSHLEPAELRERVLREVQAFVGEADQHDDMTMILLKIDPVGYGAADAATAAAAAGAGVPAARSGD